MVLTLIENNIMENTKLPIALIMFIAFILGFCVNQIYKRITFDGWYDVRTNYPILPTNTNKIIICVCKNGVYHYIFGYYKDGRWLDDKTMDISDRVIAWRKFKDFEL